MTIYGRNAIKEALASNSSVHKLFIQESIKKDQKVSEILFLARSKNVQAYFVGIHDLDKLSNGKSHQGVAAEVNLKTYSSLKAFLKQETSFIHDSFIYIFESQLSQNIGAIIRTAEVAGIRGVIIPPKQNLTAEAVKISTGAVFNLPIIQESIFNTLKTAKTMGYQIAGIERNGTKYSNASLDMPTLFIIGGEDKELTGTIRSKCDVILEIPQYGKINSLNMSVASGIILFEHIKQLEEIKNV